MRDVIAVCRSSKKARVKVAAILDAYLWRIGDRAWRGKASDACLRRISDDLKASASKNMAVSVHDAKRHHAHQEPLFFVGSRKLFSHTGISPISVSTTEKREKAFSDVDRNILMIAVFFHDMGKGLTGFQDMIRSSMKDKRKTERFRHEFLSANMFDELTTGMSDEEALLLLSALSADKVRSMVESDEFIDRMRGQGPKSPSSINFIKAEAGRELITLIGMLILTHHRLPGLKDLWEHKESYKPDDAFRNNVHVRNADFSADELKIPENLKKSIWSDDNLYESLRRSAKGLVGTNYTASCGAGHLFLRTAMIFADRAGSRDEQFTQSRSGLLANTQSDQKTEKDDLETHTRKVAGYITDGLRAVSEKTEWPMSTPPEELLSEQSGRFSWQNDAVAGAKSCAQEDGGVFGVIMAGTGTGKTRAGLAVACAARKGLLRVTNCLGLRTLTKQTAKAYVEDGLISKRDVCAVVGGSIIKNNGSEKELTPSQSIQALSPRVNDIRQSDDGELGKDTDEPNLGLLDAVFDKGAMEKRLLSAPVLVCTVDHMIPSSSPLRTNHIASSMRLLSSDVIMDELDQYSAWDLISIMRLIQIVGASGKNLFIMSATMPVEVAKAAYEHFLSGRREFMKRTGSQNGVRSFCVSDVSGSLMTSGSFSDNLEGCLIAMRQEEQHADNLNVTVQLPLKSGREVSALEETVRTLHSDHHIIMNIHGKPVKTSVGVIKLTKIRDVNRVAASLKAEGIRKICLHSGLPSFQRSLIEKDLAHALNRKSLPEGNIAKWVEREVDPKDIGDDLIIAVICSPVIETGNDVDFDWAISEPNAGRDLVQFVGRVNRHRRTPIKVPNVMVMSTFWDADRKSHSRPGLLDVPDSQFTNVDEDKFDALCDLREGPLKKRGLKDLYSHFGVDDGDTVRAGMVHGDSVITRIERMSRETILSWDGLLDLSSTPQTSWFSRTITGLMPFRGGGAGSSMFVYDKGWKIVVDDVMGLGNVTETGAEILGGDWFYDTHKMRALLIRQDKPFRTMVSVTTFKDEVVDLLYNPQLGVYRR